MLQRLSQGDNPGYPVGHRAGEEARCPSGSPKGITQDILEVVESVRSPHGRPAPGGPAVATAHARGPRSGAAARAAAGLSEEPVRGAGAGGKEGRQEDWKEGRP